jgi:hypothetical protein
MSVRRFKSVVGGLVGLTSSVALLLLSVRLFKLAVFCYSLGASSGMRFRNVIHFTTLHISVEVWIVYAAPIGIGGLALAIGIWSANLLSSQNEAA